MVCLVATLDRALPLRKYSMFVAQDTGEYLNTIATSGELPGFSVNLGYPSTCLLGLSKLRA